MISCYHLRSTVVLLLTAFHVFVAAAVAGLVAAVDMIAGVFISLSSGDSTVPVPALQSGRSPHGGGELHVGVRVSSAFLLSAPG